MTKNTEFKHSRVIANLAIGPFSSWYSAGQRRLKNSIKDQPLTSIFMRDKLEPTPGRTAYEDKIAFIDEAWAMGANRLLWLDCSITLLPGKSLDPIWDWIDKEGLYIYPSGFKSGQTANSKALRAYETTTDEQMEVNEIASNVVGINLEHPVGRNFLAYWVASLQFESNNSPNRGRKWPATESERMADNPDERFLFSRQDQTTATLAAWKTKVPADCWDMSRQFVFRKDEEDIKPTSILMLKGGER